MRKVIGIRKKKAKKDGSHSSRRCNLCSARFSTRSKFDRICSVCKESSPLYRFHDWIPSRDDVCFNLESRVSA